MGIGLVLVVEAGSSGEVLRRLAAAGERPVMLGEVRRGEARHGGRPAGGGARPGGGAGLRAGGQVEGGVELVR
jgi:hypothetical protein